MAKKTKVPEVVELNDGYYHEVLHVSYMFQDMIEDYLIQHPAISQNPDLLKMATEAQEKLGDLYQAIGERIHSL